MNINLTNHNVFGEIPPIVRFLESVFLDIGVISDSEFRNTLLKSGVFSKGKKISKKIPGPCGVSHDGQTGVYLVLGTGDQMYKRISTAFHSRLENIVFVVQSDALAWWRENNGKIKQKKGNGNRVSFSVFNEIISKFVSWNGWGNSINLIQITTDEAENELEII